jgi:peptide subunit release factor 1 (eRF1)
MPLVKVNMYDNRYLYRCADCGYESHHTPVREHELGPPPQHSCPKAGRQFDEFMPTFEKQDGGR